MRLIDADKLEKQLNERWKALSRDWGDYDTYANGFYEAINYAEIAFTVDAVPVVRCEDCKYWRAQDEQSDSGCCFYTPDGDKLVGRKCAAEHYCGHGERRTNAEE